MVKIGIIGAMELEVEQLKKEMNLNAIIRKAGMDFHEGTLDDVPVVIVRCGIGKVNAALCVQILADEFRISHVINTGVAGSLNARLDIGDILVSKDAIHHDMDVRVFGYQLGEVPQIGFREFQADEHLVAFIPSLLTVLTFLRQERQEKEQLGLEAQSHISRCTLGLEVSSGYAHHEGIAR